MYLRKANVFRGKHLNLHEKGFAVWGCPSDTAACGEAFVSTGER